MKKLKFLFVLMISMSIIATSCSKSEDSDVTPDVPTPSYKGEANIVINGTTYNDIILDVVEYTDSEEGTIDVGCHMKGGFTQGNPEISENNFVLVITNIPNIGETATFTNLPEETDTQIIILGSPVEGYTRYMAVSGTVTRESADKYTLDASLIDIPGFVTNFTISGTIEVGTHTDL